MLVLGAWSTRINKYGAFAGSALAGILYVMISPYVFPQFAVGKGLIANLGYAAALVAVPVGFIVTILVSLAAEKMSAVDEVTRAGTQTLVESMHGWPSVEGTRYGATSWLIVLCLLWLPVLWWGLQPW
jgi:cation/acetate symporter